MKKMVLIFLLSILAVTSYAKKNCTALNKKAVCNQEKIKEIVGKMCKAVESNRADAFKKIKKFRFDCCGEPNYVWVNDLNNVMLVHPIKPQLVGKDLSNLADPNGKKLIVEFVKSVKKKPAGAWVEYMWTKFGESDPSAKISWVQLCKPDGKGEGVVVGAGTWKD